MATNSNNPLRDKLSSMATLCGKAGNRHLCEQCSPHERLLCNATASEIAGDVLSEMVIHFGTQERVMRETGLFREFRDVCERHMQDHGDMSETAARMLAKPNNGPLTPRVAELSDVLGNWLERHDEEFDQALRDLLKR